VGEDRIEDNSIAIGRALEANFDNPESAFEERIRSYIVEYRDRQAIASGGKNPFTK